MKCDMCAVESRLSALLSKERRDLTGGVLIYIDAEESPITIIHDLGEKYFLV